MNQLMVSLIAAIGGWLVALVLAITSYLERRSQRKQELLLSGLGYLTGGSQKRSVGIAIIEGLWPSAVRFRRSLVPALTNQALYLLLESDEGDARHEFHNWLRIMNLLLSTNREDDFHDLYRELANALVIRIEDGKHKRGIEITPTTARAWLRKVEEFGGFESIS